MKISKSLITLFLTFLLLTLFLSTAHSDDSETSFTRDATIMEIDLTIDQIIVGEKYIQLLSRGTDSSKTWVTTINDANGNSLSPKVLKINDRVIVKGYIKDSGNWIAENILLIGSEESPLPTKKIKPSSGNKDIKLDDGVWKN